MIADKIMNHNKYMKKVKGMTESELRFVLKDAGEAVAANPTNPNNEYYLDEINYCQGELHRRQNGGKCRKITW